MNSTFSPINAANMSKKEKEDTLELLISLKEKRDGNFKGRACADGQKQYEGPKNKDTISPTLALESVLITSYIEVHERRGMDMVGIPGTFLNAYMDNDVIMILIGRLA